MKHQRSEHAAKLQPLEQEVADKISTAHDTDTSSNTILAGRNLGGQVSKENGQSAIKGGQQNVSNTVGIHARGKDQPSKKIDSTETSSNANISSNDNKAHTRQHPAAKTTGNTVLRCSSHCLD